MSKIIVQNKAGDAKIPFLRGILTRSLQEDAGLSFEDAYQVATEIRQQLSATDEIKSKGLAKMVAQFLEKKFDLDTAQRYSNRKKPEKSIQVVGVDGITTPFSTSRLRQCLESCALAPEVAGDISTKIHFNLTDQGIISTTSREVCRQAYQLLKDSMGEKTAHRYLVWVEYLRTNRPLIILLGGCSGSGKSTIALELSHRLDIVRMQSTDMLREVMRLTIPQNLMPTLHASSFTAWKTMPGRSDPNAVWEKLLVDGFRTQAEQVGVAIEGVLQRATRERVSMIIEGVHLCPSILTRERENLGGDPIIVPIMVGTLSKKQLKKQLRGRSVTAPSRRSKRYMDNFHEIWQLQSFLLSQADRMQVALVRNRRLESAITDILDVITNILIKDFAGDPKTVLG